MSLLRSSLPGAKAPNYRPALSALSVSLLALAPAMHADKPAPAPAPLPPGVAAPAPATVTAPAINVLLLAFDDVLVTDPPPVAGTAIIPEGVIPEAVVAPAVGITDLAPLPQNGPDIEMPPALPGITPAGDVPAPITPARFTVPPLMMPQPMWLVNAQSRRDRERALEDQMFRMEPDRSTPGGIIPGPATSPGPDFTGALPIGTADAPPTPAPPGRAQMTSLTLRRAMLAQGWADILPIAPDSTAVWRALGERRLTKNTFNTLRRSLSVLSGPGASDPKALKDAVAAASRVGQALGYRAVIAFYVTPGTPKDNRQISTFSFVVADSGRETGEPLVIDEQGATESGMLDAGALSAAALLDKTLRTWPEQAGTDRRILAQRHIEAGRAASQAGDLTLAQDELTQAIALDSRRSDPYKLLGDALNATDPLGAALAYRRAVDLDNRDGATWAKIASAYTHATPPDWPNALDAARKALASSFDSVELRLAMATAQYGRADLFRKAGRIERAEDAEAEARQHLDRALQLAPNDANAIRLLGLSLVKAKRYSEAAQTLDRVALQFPRDLEIQTQYATALAGIPGREADAFAAYARVWQLSGVKGKVLDALDYRTMVSGFDIRVYEIGKSAVQLTAGVANGALPREDALGQLIKLKEDMDAAENAIKIMQAPMSIPIMTHNSRLFAANLMSQSLEADQIYLETGQELQRTRGTQLNTQAINRLNSARNGMR